MTGSTSVALPPIAAQRADEPLRGILLVIGALLLFSTSDATAKYVTRTLPAIEVAWVRYAVFVLLTLAPAVRQGPALLRTRRLWLQLGRGVAVALSALLFILGLGKLPLAEAAAINFVSPLFITALSVPMLGEKVGLRRWLALAVGLGGVVLAAHPGSGAFQAAALYPLLSAAAWAIGMIFTRQLAATDRPATTLAWSALSGLALLSVFLPGEARLPDATELWLCILIGVVAASGQFLVVLGYRLAPASLLAPFSYLQLISSGLLGYIVFAARPGNSTILGAAVIAGSGLYTASRERARR